MMAEHVYKNNDAWSVEQGSIAPQWDYNRKPKYIVKNCPAYRAGMNLPHYCKAVGCCINTYTDGMDCTTINNCLLKKK